MYLEIKDKVEAKTINIEFKAKEKTEFTRFYTEFEGEGEHRKAVTKSKREKAEHRLF